MSTTYGNIIHQVSSVQRYLIYVTIDICKVCLTHFIYLRLGLL